MRSTLAVLALGLAATGAHAADEPRYTILANGMFAPSSVTYESTRTFNAFAEEGRHKDLEAAAMELAEHDDWEGLLHVAEALPALAGKGAL